MTVPDAAVRLDYARLARAAGRRAPITLRPIRPTRAQERALARLYLTVLDVWTTGRVLAAYERSLATYTGDSPADIQAEIEATEQGAVRAIFDFGQLFRDWFHGLQLWHINRLGAQLTYADNVTLQTVLGPATETFEDLLARNVALVRDVSDQTRGRIADIVFRNLQLRTPARDVAREINEATGLGRKRSLRIASDQLQKSSAALDQLRQEQLGFTSFKWRHSGKVHYRPEHLARDGKIFSWSSEVARTDPPGYAPFCGCRAMAYMDPSEG